MDDEALPNVRDEGSGCEMSMRAASIVSRVDSDRLVTSSGEKPAVDIGGSTNDELYIRRNPDSSFSSSLQRRLDQQER